MSKFSETLDYLMKTHDMSNDELADLVGVNRTTISRWRSGSRSPKMEKLSELAAIFKVLPQDFVEGNSDYPDISYYYNLLDDLRKSKAFDYTKRLYTEQNTISDNVVPFPTTLNLDAVVSAGTGEWQDGTLKEEVEYNGQIPNHDYVVRVNGDSMQPLFEDNQILFIRKTHDVRDGQIIVCTLNNETYVKKIMGNRLVSLNKKYDDIQINEYDDFSVVGVVVL
ncbi:XRE family transcriptional regulator [Enterococcus cecorum]|uniref:XRE family transcriptional regulator n=1 Tax=Enterococcus cecorum TaxID=44008 RepID=UPI001FACB983|nr:XRE family transcriptional regulator [Enterococcus cecorum]MCJ0570784.1 XRE family transcriptional regulator [Enterococcus cecorum]MCJ0589194.1 XRE family transcriptional regulator [Enterococcus cecorum]